MEVTRSNFNESLLKIKRSISESTFLTIDCELTGLNTNNDINGYDSQKTYYEKVRKGCRDFLVIQYGLCAFRYDATTDEFIQEAYNFYIFPKAIPKHVPDQRFLCQVSSIDFLTTQKFDFNKLFREGIPYLNEHQEDSYRESLKEAQKARVNYRNTNDTNRVVCSKEQDQAFIKKISKLIREFIDSEEDELVLPKCNRFLRLLIYQLVRSDFDNKVDLKTRTEENHDKVLVVSKFKGADARLEEEKRLIREEEDELENTIGFSKVMQFVAQSGKLVVGHNMFLDLLHTIDKFLVPLPEDYDEFKECSHMLFSQVLDTKYMSNADPFKPLIESSVLGHLLETVAKPPFEVPAVRAASPTRPGYDLADGRAHEAGYDAFATGVAFLALWRHLGTAAGLDSTQTFANLDLLEPYTNKLFLMRLQDGPYVNLGGADPTPSRDHVFHLTFPKEWKSNDLVQLFSPFGLVHIAWIDEKSAYVGLVKRDQAKVVLNTLSQSDTYTIMKYENHVRVLEERRLKAGSPGKKGAKRRRRSQEVEAVPVARRPRKREVSRTFAENDSWE